MPILDFVSEIPHVRRRVRGRVGESDGVNYLYQGCASDVVPSLDLETGLIDLYLGRDYFCFHCRLSH